jgi:histidyl-tRNA synthetase
LVLLFDAAHTGDYLRIGRKLRAAGIETEVSCDPRAIGKQLAYANRKGFHVALIAGETEFAQGSWQVKDLKAGQQSTVSEADLPEAIRRILG